jgi:hypothetical protein
MRPHTSDRTGRATCLAASLSATLLLILSNQEKEPRLIEGCASLTCVILLPPTPPVLGLSYCYFSEYFKLLFQPMP